MFTYLSRSSMENNQVFANNELTWRLERESQRAREEYLDARMKDTRYLRERDSENYITRLYQHTDLGHAPVDPAPAPVLFLLLLLILLLQGAFSPSAQRDNKVRARRRGRPLRQWQGAGGWYRDKNIPRPHYGFHLHQGAPSPDQFPDCVLLYLFVVVIKLSQDSSLLQNPPGMPPWNFKQLQQFHLLQVSR